MAVYVITEINASRDDYDKLRAELDVPNTRPAGLLVHATADVGDGKLKSIDIWDGYEAAQRFYTERLAPALEGIVGPNPLWPVPPEMGEIYYMLGP